MDQGDLRVVVGATRAEGHGQVYVYRRHKWSGRHKLETVLSPIDEGGERPGPRHFFGASVDIDGDRIAVGAPGNPDRDIEGDSLGLVYLYKYDGDSWQ
ncbi:hypothetical protein KIPB_006856, partial [Kipferlia bialata]|eukprot:g6856.t1